MASNDACQLIQEVREKHFRKKMILASFDKRVNALMNDIIFRQAQINVNYAYEILVSQHPEYEHDITLKIDFFLKELKKERRKLEKALDKLLEEYKKEE